MKRKREQLGRVGEKLGKRTERGEYVKSKFR